MAEYENDKFIVVSWKRVHELKKSPFSEFADKFLSALMQFGTMFEMYSGKEVPIKYYVCNQDEPYAQKVIDVILEGEREKEKEPKCIDCGKVWKSVEEWPCPHCGNEIPF
jgi:hypothetical protein